MGSWALWESPARWSIRAFARTVVRRNLAVAIEGLEHLPAAGPTIVAARHYHHLYDAALLLTVVERPIHFLVALDWVDDAAGKLLMETACRTARWPVMLRSGSPNLRASGDGLPTRPYSLGDAQPYLRRALRDAHELLREGRLLVIFPEGYPNIDPTFTMKAGPDAWLPFSPIVARIAVRSERSDGRPVSIVPAGLAYEPGETTRVTLRFGPVTSLAAAGGATALTRQLETEVVALSGAATPGQAHHAHRAPIAMGGDGPPARSASRRERRAAVDSACNQRDG